MGLESDFLNFINKNKLFSKEDAVLLALSGGNDSLALFHLLNNAGYKFEIAHCNFKLRGEASDADEAFVKTLCGNKIVCHTTHFETENYAQSHAISIQMAARELRYGWFESLRTERSLKYILTAHHLNDKLETLLFNIAKGSGPAGYRSIPLKTGNVVRPLLFCSLESIEAFLDAKSYKWREDASNAETKYSRNKIRAKVIPALKEINPGLESTALVNFKRLDQWYEIFQAQFDDFNSKKSELGFDIAYLKTLAGGQLLFEEYVKPFGFTFQQVEALFEGFRLGSRYLTASHHIYVGRTHVQIEENNIEFEAVSINKCGEYTINNEVFTFEISQYKPTMNELRNTTKIYLDNDKLVWPLLIRKWEQGDTFKPFGMKGSKLVSDYLIDTKIEMSEKERTLVLIDQHRIVSLVGLRNGEECKVDENTRNVLILSRMKKENL